jgi:hypothetical protein
VLGGEWFYSRDGGNDIGEIARAITALPTGHDQPIGLIPVCIRKTEVADSPGNCLTVSADLVEPIQDDEQSATFESRFDKMFGPLKPEVAKRCDHRLLDAVTSGSHLPEHDEDRNEYIQLVVAPLVEDTGGYLD